MSQVIVIDFFSVVPELKKDGRNLSGTPAPGLVSWVTQAQEKGNTIYFIAGAAHDPFWRQNIERYLEQIGIRAVFVTHGLPDGYDWFVSTKAFMFDGEHFPVT